MTESSTTILRRLLDERGVEWENRDGFNDWKTKWERGRTCSLYTENKHSGFTVLEAYTLTPDQAVATMLGRPKAKSHPYGYEPDTGAFDATRCECGCINDISATYCNDCGGEIEIDMNAKKEIYEHQCRVFVIKHDDGSLEFCEKRYIAAMPDGMNTAVDDVLSLLDEMNEQGRIEYADYSQLHDAITDKLNAMLGSKRELELKDALNDVAEKWAIAQVQAEDSARRCRLLEKLVQDWQVLYDERDYGDCCRLRKRMQDLGIEVIDE